MDIANSEDLKNFLKSLSLLLKVKKWVQILIFVRVFIQERRGMMVNGFHQVCIVPPLRATLRCRLRLCVRGMKGITSSLLVSGRGPISF